jgi:energy-coupling factor transporter ATP-binding protein EcfA2
VKTSPEYNVLVDVLIGLKLTPAVGRELFYRTLRNTNTTLREAPLIGLCGPKGCGKSTIATHLGYLVGGLEDHEVKVIPAWSFAFTHLRFAGPIKAMARALGLTAEQVDGAEKETPCDLLGGLTPRFFMQRLGTEFGRDLIGPELWVRATMQAADEKHTNLTVIDDVRFTNEAEAIRKRGGLIIELRRDGAEYNIEHASEAGLPRELIHTSIDNSGDPKRVALAVMVFAATQQTKTP